MTPTPLRPPLRPSRPLAQRPGHCAKLTRTLSKLQHTFVVSDVTKPDR